MVLELGAGCGLAGLAAAWWGGARAVWLTDLDPVLPNLRDNAALNEPGASPVTAPPGPEQPESIGAAANPTLAAGNNSNLSAAAPAAAAAQDAQSGHGPRCSYRTPAARGCEVHVAGLDWDRMDLPAATAAVPTAVDVVLAADVLYSWCPAGVPDLLLDDAEPLGGALLVENNANVASAVGRLMRWPNGVAWLVANELRGDDVAQFCAAATGLGMVVTKSKPLAEMITRAEATAGRFVGDGERVRMQRRNAAVTAQTPTQRSGPPARRG